MGVTGLWTVVQPCARPIKIETLNRKRLAVDASIWIYQFLKAVRDKEGNALRNSHVVGFFRRVCKLLFIGIKPVFVFDGGAPALKRQTISGRKQRREGRREDAVRTAGKLLALQMQRRAEEEEQSRKEAARRPAQRQEEELPEDLVYVDELQMTQQERQQNRKFKKKDQYHLPDLDMSMAEMGGPNDPRVMSLEELEQYARQFDTGEDINVYDFSKIDFNSPFFVSLPASDRYNILNAARLRSRLRMGYSKDQLDTMFPDRMAFSRFQIERVKERNELTQRLMHVNGMNDDSLFGLNGGGRVEGEKGREYVLVKNAGVEGGWALGVIGDRDQGERSKPIDVDELGKQSKDDVGEEDWQDDDNDFEDVPIEGLNRLPKRNAPPTTSSSEETTRAILNQRTAGYAARRKQRQNKPKPGPPLRTEDSTSLFVGPDVDLEGVEGEVAPVQDDTDDEELQRAIAMSLEANDRLSSPEDDDFEEVFQQTAKDPTPLSSQPDGRTADTGNIQPARIAPPLPFAEDSDDDTMDFASALAESRRSKRQPRAVRSTSPKTDSATSKPTVSQPVAQRPTSQKFDGPLPFEKLDLGSSILGRNKMKKLEEDNAGGFEKKVENVNQQKAAAPVPPWFSGDLKEGMEAQKALEHEDRERARELDEKNAFDFGTQPRLRTQETTEVIDVDLMEDKSKEVVFLDSSEDESEKAAPFQNIIVEDLNLRMGDLADKLRVEPPKESDVVALGKPEVPGLLESQRDDDIEDEPYEWEASDHGDGETPVTKGQDAPQPVQDKSMPREARSPSLEFENVGLSDAEPVPRDSETIESPLSEDEEQGPLPMSGAAADQGPQAYDSDDQDNYSDPEDEELMEQLAIEAEEHARFASTLNHKTQRQNVEEYERELKSLRTQQKKDRRDADEVTHVMVSECQALLKLFGLPYITAPMEAEAQCAELVSLGLVDGIVTDDSDIFLFGGTRVYKNMFNQAKFVECYLTSDLEREFDLTRSKLIRIAHLLGSDYTEGLPGIGPVTALELLAEFPGGLGDFREWWARVQTGAPPTDEDAASAFRRKFRRNSTKLFLPPVFPDQRVDLAYLQPDVDKDPSAFEWGVPDLDALRAFLMATIGWSQERTDEVLVPVIRDMNRRATEGTQANITSFLGGGGGGGGGAVVGAGAFAPRRKQVGKSKRMEEALEKMAASARRRKDVEVGGEHEEGDSGDGAVTASETAQIGGGETDGEIEGVAAARRESAKVKTKPKARAKRKSAISRDESGVEDGSDTEPKPKRKRTGRKGAAK